MNKVKQIFIWILLPVLFLISGCGLNNKDTFPTLPDQELKSVVISNGLMGVDLPPVEDQTTIHDLQEFIEEIDYIEKDDTEIIGGGYGVTFVYLDSSIQYDFLRDDYVAVRIKDEEFVQYRIDSEKGAAIYNYLQTYVQEHS